MLAEQYVKDTTKLAALRQLLTQQRPVRAHAPPLVRLV
jgi:hypothetical protein